MKKFLSLALMIGGALMTLVTAYEVYGIYLYESEGGNQGLSAADWLFIVSPTILSLAAVFVGWRLYKSIPEKPYSEASKSKQRAGLFVALLGVAIAFSPVLVTFLRQLPRRNIFIDGPGAEAVELWLMLFTLPLGALIAIFGLVKRSDAKNLRIQTRVEPTAKPVEQTPIADADKAQEPAQIVNPDESGDQEQTSSEDQAVYQPRSCTQVGLILIAMFIGLNICFGAVSSFMNMSLNESWGILGVLQLLAGGAIIFWGIRRLRNK
jgi:hypothetical protein